MKTECRVTKPEPRSVSTDFHIHQVRVVFLAVREILKLDRKKEKKYTQQVSFIMQQENMGHLIQGFHSIS